MAIRTLFLVTVVSILSTGNAMATLIDSFGDGEQFLRVTSRSTTAYDQGNPGSSIAIGGYRDIALQWLSGQASYVAAAADEANILEFTQGTGEAKTTITWDGPGARDSLSYSLNADLSAEKEFLLDVAGVTGTGVAVTLTVYTDATHASTYSATLAEGTTGTVAIPYTSFTVLGSGVAVDFAHVGAIVLGIDGTGNVGSDIAINSISTAVPEPASLTLLAAGAIGLLCIGRRRWLRNQ
ncbi:MAG: PEP-CTERM sorting domain-containing protein [Thermoguttaceae bacterium]